MGIASGSAQRYWLLAMSVMAFLITSCGGGGGGGDGGGGTSSPSLSMSAYSIDRSASLSLAPDAATILINVPDGTDKVVGGYPAGQSKPVWLHYSFNRISIQQVELKVGFGVLNMSAGTYTDALIVEARRADGVVLASATLRTTMRLTDPLQANLDRIEFNTSIGATQVPSQSVALSQVGAGSSWTANVTQPWIRLNASGGTTPFNLEVSANLSGLPVGRYEGTVNISDSTLGTSTQVPVILRVEPRRLTVSDDGIALVSTPGRARLAHTVAITSHGRSPIVWSAVSNQPWLRLSSASGTTDSSLTLTANTTGLAIDTIHYANVTLSSSDPGVSNTEVIRIGLYVSSTDGQEPATVSGLPQRPESTGMVADPIRPYVYVSHGTSSIHIYNVYTAALVGTITGAASDAFRDLEVSSDGATIYAVNRGVSPGTIVPINLATRSVGAAWTGLHLPANLSNPQIDYLDLRYARLNGHPVLVTGGAQIVDALTGTLLKNLNAPGTYFTAPIVALTPNGENAFVAYANYAYLELDRYQLWYSRIDNSATAYLSGRRARVGFEQGPKDMAMSHDGNFLISAQAGLLYTYDRFTLQPLLRGAFGFPLVAVAKGPVDKVYTTWTRSTSADVVTLDSSFGEVSRKSITGNILDRKVVASSDGMRLALRNRDGITDGLILTNIAP